MQGGSSFLVTLLCYLLPSPTPLAENRVKVAVKRGQSQINLRFAEWETSGLPPERAKKLDTKSCQLVLKIGPIGSRKFGTAGKLSYLCRCN